jgi:uncharacterized membrane protein
MGGCKMMKNIKKNADFWSILGVVVLTILIVVMSRKAFVYKSPFKDVRRNLQYEVAKVIAISKEDVSKDPTVPTVYIGSQELKIEMLTGDYAGQQFEFKNPLSRLYSVRAKVGMQIIVNYNVVDNKVTNLFVYSYKRSNVVYGLIAVFFAMLILIGKLKGLKSVIALVFSTVLIFFYMLPSILSGYNAVISATITAILIIVASLLLIGGYNNKTYTAIIGTAAGVVISGLIFFAAARMAHLSGLTSENIEDMLIIAESYKFNVKGVMYAAVLIASLGAVMDTGISIASAIFEMHEVNPKLDKSRLFKSGMNVGKDVIGTMSNTLIMAFVGSSLTLLILIMAANMTYLQISNLDILCTEVITGIAGSIAIVLTVPLTASISVLFIEKSRRKISVVRNKTL